MPKTTLTIKTSNRQALAVLIVLPIFALIMFLANL